MIFEGCQGKKGVKIQEKTCPNCGNTVEMMSTDAYVQCEECGFTIYSDLMDCVFRCSKAKECVGEEQYEKLSAARAKWEAEMEKNRDDDLW